jgi:hypothetical protein
MTPTVLLLSTVVLMLTDSTLADPRFRLPTPQRPATVKLNQQHLFEQTSDPISTAEIIEDDTDEEGFSFFFGDGLIPWDDITSSTNHTPLENVWLPFNDPTNNATENITTIIGTNISLSLVEQLFNTIEAAFSNVNASKTVEFAFVTRIQLAPHACPSDTTQLFNQALRSSNPGTGVSSKTVRAGSTLCNNDCPCSDRNTRHLITKTIEIHTTSTSPSLHMPTRSQFPMPYEVVSSV